MSRWIRLSDSRGRDARVRMEAGQSQPPVKYQTASGQTATPARIIKSHLKNSYARLVSQYPAENQLARYLMEADPEIDFEAAGRRVGHTERVLLDSNHNMLYAADYVEVITDPSGNEVERREVVDVMSNIDTESPLAWTGRLFKRSEAIRKFVFSRNYQIRHIDGLTFDFLLSMALELDQADSLVLVGGGSRGHDPLILERNGLSYRGFLEGRVQGETYMLILHLSHLELIPPEVNPA